MKAAFLALSLVLAAPVAEAAVFTTTFQQVGANVVATGSGSFDLSGMGLTFSPIIQENRIWGATNFFLFGSGNSTAYDLEMTGPAFSGVGGEVFADSWSGDQVGIWVDADRIYVPVGYVSGAALANSATWSSQTIGGLGLTKGLFAYTFGNNTFNIVVDDVMSAVPVAPALPLLASAFGLLALMRRRRLA